MITTTSMSDRAYAALCELRDRLPDLAAVKVPGGAPRRWRELRISPEAMARQAERDRAERAERVEQAARGITPPGESPAPVVLSVLDTEHHIHESIAALEIRVCQWLGLTPLTAATPAARITRVAGLLGRLARVPSYIDHVAAEAGRLVRRARRALGEDEPVAPFAGRCPVCSSRSLRALPERGLIVCTNPGCQCGGDSCPCARGRWHTWSYAEMAELAVAS